MSVRLLNDRFGDIAPDCKNINSVLPSRQDFFLRKVPKNGEKREIFRRKNKEKCGRVFR